MALVVAGFLCFLGWCGSGLVPGERELRPPRAGIEIGSLYFVRERPTDDVSKPANLERLCTINLARYGVTPKPPQPVADIDLLGKLEVEGALSGLRTELASLGVSGSLNNFFEYKLTNVNRVDIDYVDAEKIFKERATREDCLNWRGNIEANKWGIYQIQSISIGDISFSRKREFGVAGDASAKLGTLEPKLKASIKRTTGAQFGGKGLVVTFSPIKRN
jgi:hypothetical protein